MSPAIFEHTGERVGALRGHKWDEVANLRPGEMLLAVTLSTDPQWRTGSRRVRPPRFMHGGYTRAVI